MAKLSVWMQHMVLANAYDFTLITLLVVEEYGEGFPVAWWTNKVNRVVLIEFSTSVRTWCGMVRPL